MTRRVRTSGATLANAVASSAEPGKDNISKAMTRRLSVKRRRTKRSGQGQQSQYDSDSSG